MKIGIVLSKPPEYSETFFISKVKGLQAHGYSVVLYTQSTVPSRGQQGCYPFEVKLAPPIYKRNIVKQSIWFARVFFKLLLHIKPVLRFIQLEKQQGTTFGVILKRLYLNAHILTQQMDWLHFGFATMALGKEQVAESINAKMAVSLRGFDIAIYPVKHLNCFELLWKKVDKVHTISNDLYKLALNNGLSTSIPFQKITPAINTKLFSFNVKKEKSSSSPIKMMTIARLHWKKGLTYTLTALKLLKEQGVDFHYTIVGEGVEYEKLMYLRRQLGLEKEVTLIGKVAHHQIKELLTEHNYYIQYSISEGFCNAVLEAQAMGLLCIVSDAEGLSENVLHKKSGWVVEKRNPKKLTETLLEVSKMLDIEQNNIREFAMKRVKNEFNIEKQQEAFVNFYNLDT